MKFSGVVVLNVETENTVDEEELWVLDFQRYDLDGTMAVVADNAGGLKADNTGSCSNIFNDATYSVSNVYKMYVLSFCRIVYIFMVAVH